MDLNALRQSRVVQSFYSVIAGHRMCFRSATLSNPGSLKTVASTHFSRESRSGSSRWKTRDPDHAAILADIDSELDPAVRYSSGRPRLPTALAKMSPGPPDRRAGLRPSDQAAPLWVFTSIAGPLSTPRAPPCRAAPPCRGRSAASSVPAGGLAANRGAAASLRVREGHVRVLKEALCDRSEASGLLRRSLWESTKLRSAV